MKKKHICLVMAFITSFLFIILLLVFFSNFLFISQRPVIDEKLSTIDFAELNSLYGYQYDWEAFDYSTWFDNLEKIERDLFAYLNTKQSIGVDIQYYLPFLDIAYSQDRRIRLINWYKDTGGTLHEYTTLVQYIPLSGEPVVFVLSDIKRFFSIYDLNDNIYLLVGGQKLDGSTVALNYGTIKIENDEPILYDGFNGEPFLSDYIQPPYNERNELSYIADDYIPRGGLPWTIYLRCNDRSYVFDRERYIGNYYGL